MTETRTSQRRRMIIFHGDEAQEVDDAMMPREGIDEDIMAGLEKITAVNFEEGVGDQVRVLFKEPGENGMSLLHVWFKSGYILPFHSHSTDCLYYITAGELHMGAHVLKKGDGFFIPGGHGYGYEAGPEGVEVLEFRNASHFNLLFSKNPLERWQKIADSYVERADIWKEEIPPSER